MAIDNAALINQEISSTSFLPADASTDGNLRDIRTVNGLSVFNDYNVTEENTGRVEFVIPNSASNAVASTANQQSTYNSGLMSSDEDESDED